MASEGKEKHTSSLKGQLSAPKRNSLVFGLTAEQF